MPDAVPLIGGMLGIVACGWCLAEGIRTQVSRFPTHWFLKGVFEFDREFDPGAYMAVMAMNLAGLAACGWSIAEALN